MFMVGVKVQQIISLSFELFPKVNILRTLPILENLRLVLNLDETTMFHTLKCPRYDSTIIGCFLFQGTMTYELVGDFPAPYFFAVHPTEGVVSVKNDLALDTAFTYLVSD